MSGVVRVLVLHDFGAAEGGAPWAPAFAVVGIEAAAPNLPGHGGAEPAVGQCYQLPEASVMAAQFFAEQERVEIVVAVGASGWAGQIVALAGRCDRLVLVDGLGGPFLEVADLMVERRERIRAMAAFDGPAMVDGLDPRTQFAPPGPQDRAMAIEAAQAMPVPTLVIETPSSNTLPDDAAEVARSFPTEIVALDERAPSAVADAVASWLEAR